MSFLCIQLALSSDLCVKTGEAYEHQIVGEEIWIYCLFQSRHNKKILYFKDFVAIPFTPLQLQGSAFIVNGDSNCK